MKNWSGGITKALSASVVVGLAFLGTSQGWAQKKEGSLTQQLVGTWIRVSSIDKKADGSAFEPFGKNPKGILMLDQAGHFSAVIIGDARIKFASNNRLEGSPEENKGMAQGSLAYFGKYSVDEEGHVITFHVEGSSYANWDGLDQKRAFTLTANELKWTNLASSGGGTAVVVWKRVK